MADFSQTQSMKHCAVTYKLSVRKVIRTTKKHPKLFSLTELGRLAAIMANMFFRTPVDFVLKNVMVLYQLLYT